MNNDMSFIYVGKGVEDGSIEVGNLICGLGGLVKLSEVILDAYEPSRKNTSLRIKSFNTGSFKTIIDAIEKRPVLAGAAALALVAVIPALSDIFINAKQINARQEEVKALHHMLQEQEMRRVLHHILEHDALMRKARKGFHDMALPLNEDGVDSVKFGLIKSPKEIINQENKDCFLEDIDKEETYRAVTLTGELRSLDKKTLNGKFVTKDNETCSISLVMDSPWGYFNYFDKENITISGIATYEKGSNKITKIVIEQIR